jgi:HNH endonuclease
MQVITAHKVRALLDCDPLTGVFTWRVGRKAGSVAGRARSDRNGRRYVQIVINRCSKHFAHRLAWLYMTGAWPVAHIEHKDGNLLNNSWENLRERVFVATPGLASHTAAAAEPRRSGMVKKPGYETNARRDF